MNKKILPWAVSLITIRCGKKIKRWVGHINIPNTARCASTVAMFSPDWRTQFVESLRPELTCVQTVSALRYTREKKKKKRLRTRQSSCVLPVVCLCVVGAFLFWLLSYPCMLPWRRLVLTTALRQARRKVFVLCPVLFGQKLSVGKKKSIGID